MIDKFIGLMSRAAPTDSQSTVMTNVITILDELLVETYVEDKKKYYEVIHGIYKAVNGPHFDSDMATKAVAKMHNANGTTGEQVSMATATNQAGAMGIVFDKFNTYDWYYAVNMIYSDFSTVIGSSTSVYYDMAKAWIIDKDAPDGKALLYYWAMCTY